MMNKAEFEKKLSKIQEEEPDELDIEMVKFADMQDDKSSISLSDFKTVMDYSVKISLRIPRSLHMALSEEAKKEGVSLNQYALYKLSH